LFQLFFSATDQKKEIREEWKSADVKGKKALEQRVGPDNVKFALEDAESEEWILKNSKPCPKCSTPIQVDFSLLPTAIFSRFPSPDKPLESIELLFLVQDYFCKTPTRTTLAPPPS